MTTDNLGRESLGGTEILSYNSNRETVWGENNFSDLAT